MRILMLNQAPRIANRHPGYDVEPITKLLNSYASPGTKVEIHFPDDFEGSDIMHMLGAQSQLNGLHHLVEAPAIVKKIIWAQENGYDAVVSSNTFDPGVDGGRLSVDSQVIGPLRRRAPCPTRGASCARMDWKASSPRFCRLASTARTSRSGKTRFSTRPRP